MSLSQIVVIDTKNKTTLLDREATIDKAKIIQNEEALFNENLLLKEYVKGLESEKKNLLFQITKLETDILKNKDEIISVQSSTIDTFKDLRKNEAKNSDFGIYLNGAFTTREVGFSAGGSVVSKKMTYTVLYNPSVEIAAGERVQAFQFMVGIKLF